MHVYHSDQHFLLHFHGHCIVCFIYRFNKQETITEGFYHTTFSPPTANAIQRNKQTLNTCNESPPPPNLILACHWTFLQFILSPQLSPRFMVANYCLNTFTTRKYELFTRKSNKQVHIYVSNIFVCTTRHKTIRKTKLFSA